MINLIPNQDKKKVVKGFYIKLLMVLLAALTVNFFVGSAALLPAYFFSNFKKDIANNKLAEQRKGPLPKFDQDAVALIQDLNNKFQILESAKNNKFIVTERVINEIILNKMPEIKINQITYSSDNSSVKAVSVRGVAPSRESLLSFRFTLEHNPRFKNVDLPISNFIKGTNIQFSLTLVPTENVK